MRHELFPFRFRDPVTGKWVRARYRAERREIEERYPEFQITGPPEIREVDPDERRFTSRFNLMTNAELRQYDQRPPEPASDPPEPPHPEKDPPDDNPPIRKPPANAPPMKEPPFEDPSALEGVEQFLLLVFLRRYVTYCARRGRFAAMNGAARLFTEVAGPLG